MSLRWLPSLLLLTSSLALGGCDDAPGTATQVVVGVDVDPGVRALTTHVVVEVYGGASLEALTKVETRSVAYTGGALPTYLLLEPAAGDASRVYRVVATARDASESAIVSVTLESGYVRGKVLYASMRVEDSCLTVSCGTAAETCRGGSCTGTWVDPSTLQVVTDPANFFDGGMPDAGSSSDAGMGDAGASDGGSDGSSCVSVDLPDDSFVDSNCDGIDGNAADLVFVAASGNDTTGDGTMASPFRTIGKGLDAARNAGRTGVAVSAGTYAERVVLVDGISLYGGYDATNGWSRSLSNVCTISQAPSDVRSDNGTSYVEAVLASDIHARTVVDAFAIRVGDAATAPTTAGTNLYGVRIVDSMATGPAGVQLRNLDVVTYRAAPGSPGSNGAQGEPGVNGADANGRFGGAGGTATCGVDGLRPETKGGDGGNGGTDTVLGCDFGAMTSAQSGGRPASDAVCAQPAPGANAMCGAAVDASNDGSAAYYYCGNKIDHTCAAPGAVLAAAARVDASSGVHLVVTSGNSGTRGQHGTGAVGGAAGGALDRSGSVYGLDGGGGGGGSSGTCGGYPGRGGQGGGASVALLVIRSSGLGVVASEFTSGSGGDGGPGGVGGTGGNTSGLASPALGAAGTSGAQGGFPRVGQIGGYGGGGAGGSSIAQLLCSCSNCSGLSSSTGTAGTAGTGGAGGSNAACSAVNPGPAGPNGTSSAYVTNCSL